FLQDWLEAARDTRLKPLEKVADMIDKHGEGLLNDTLHRITNAMSEGLNCAIQLLKSCAKGLPNFESLRARVLFFEGKLELHPA
ncbi:MAG: transposase, partial [Verrucomicrobiales bacterium]|nr:transposase [Verrucomicrobiales bacterium]